MADGESWWTRKRIAIAATALLLVWLASPVGLCGMTRLSVCRCGSIRWEERRRLFSREGLPIPMVADEDDVRPTKALAEVFPPDHAHHWGALHGRVFNGGWATVYSGSASFPRLAHGEYEHDDGFRAALAEAIRAGRLTREEGVLLLGLGWDCFDNKNRLSREDRQGIARKGAEALREATFATKGDVLAHLARHSR